MKIYLTESQLEYIQRKEKMRLNEAVNMVDSFDEIGDLMNVTDNDRFYFVQIVKRYKDNKDKGMTKDNLGTTFNGVGEQGNYETFTAFKVRTKNDLMAIKQRVIDYCNKNNARAYMTCNPRSESAIAAYKPEYLKKLKAWNKGKLPTYAKYADEILAGQAKTDASFTDRPRFQIDVDCTKDTVLFGLNVWEVTHHILKNFGVPVEWEKESPSGGLHIYVADRFAINNLDKLVEALMVFDRYVNKKNYQLVHCNFDGKFLLYSNVDTKGY